MAAAEAADLQTELYNLLIFMVGFEVIRSVYMSIMKLRILR